MKKLKRLSLLSLSGLLALTIVGCSSKDNTEQQKKFDEFIEQEFVETMESNYLNTHILMEHPEKYGIDVSKLPMQIDDPVTEETRAKNVEDTEKSAKEFKQFDRDNLTEEQQDTYDIFAYMLENQQDSLDSKFDYMQPYFESIAGIHTQLPTLFSDLTLRNEQDVKNLITLVNSTKTYMDSLIAYTKKQEEKGTLMIDIDSVKEYCDKIVKKGEDSDVLRSMNSNIEALKLGDEKTADYEAQLKEAFTSSFVPAYQDVSKAMSELDVSKNNKKGLSNLENGKAYYEILFKDATGTDKSIEEMKKSLSDNAVESLNAARSIVAKNPTAYDAFTSGKTKTGYKDFKSMLKDLNTDIEADFPSVGALNYNIEPLSKEVASNGIAAYFNIPALDATTPNEIRVNTQEDQLDIQSLDTFATVAHEGLPGHMYQINYDYQNQSSNWRKAIPSLLGYTEGYATYVELYSLKYLDHVDANMIALQQYMTAYQNDIVALIDIGIHYEGWSIGDTSKFLEQNGLDSSAAEGLYSSIQPNPTAFLSYYAGYVEIMELKEEAQDQLGDKFYDKDFHTALLKSGTAPFSVVKKNIEAYIDDAK